MDQVFRQWSGAGVPQVKTLCNGLFQSRGLNKDYDDALHNNDALFVRCNGK